MTYQREEADRRSAATLERCRAEQAALYPVPPAAEGPSVRRPFPERVRQWTLAATGVGAAVGLALPGFGVSLALSVTWAIVLVVVLGCVTPLFVAAGEDGRRAPAQVSPRGESASGDGTNIVGRSGLGGAISRNWQLNASPSHEPYQSSGEGARIGVDIGA